MRVWIEAGGQRAADDGLGGSWERTFSLYCRRNNHVDLGMRRVSPFPIFIPSFLLWFQFSTARGTSHPCIAIRDLLFLHSWFHDPWFPFFDLSRLCFLLFPVSIHGGPTSNVGPITIVAHITVSLIVFLFFFFLLLKNSSSPVSRASLSTYRPRPQVDVVLTAAPNIIHCPGDFTSNFVMGLWKAFGSRSIYVCRIQSPLIRVMAVL